MKPVVLVLELATFFFPFFILLHYEKLKCVSKHWLLKQHNTQLNLIWTFLWIRMLKNTFESLINGLCTLWIFFHFYCTNWEKMFIISNGAVQNKWTLEKFGPETIIVPYLIRIVQRGNFTEKKNRTCMIIRYPRVNGFKSRINRHLPSVCSF